MNPFSTKYSKMIVIATLLGLLTSANPAAAQFKSPTTPDLVRNIDEPGFNGYQFSANYTTDVVGIADAELAVPLGKVAVIEHVSASGGLDGTDLVVRALLRCRNGGGVEVVHSLVLTPQGVNSGNGISFFSLSQPIKCYATTGSSTSGGLSFHLESNSIQRSQHIWVVAVSGYTVPQ
jgi:hypothetical protein